MALIRVPFVTSQQVSPLLYDATYNGGNTANVGMDKIANTYVFTGKLDLVLPVFEGSFRVVNDYRGTMFRTSTTAVRDDQFLHVGLEIPVIAGLSALVRQSWTTSVDSRSVGLASLERLNGVAGLRWRPTMEADVEMFSGAERTTQIGQRASGLLAGLRSRLTDVQLDEWRLQGNGLVDVHRMDALRTNTDVDLRAQAQRDLGEGAALRLDAHWTSLRRDFFTQVGAAADLAVESRAERRLNLTADARTELSSSLVASFNGSVQTASIDRQYAQPVTDVPITALNRTLDELIIDLAADMRYSMGGSSVTFGGAIFRRDERNGVQSRFSVDEADVSLFRSQENQRDNATLRTRAFARTDVMLSDADTIRIEGTSWLLRYDTPSDLNFDDRDELTSILTLSYGRRLSSILSAGVVAAGQYVHLVFLRAQRSALNNENRVIRLAPWAVVRGAVVQMQPMCEVLANYTVYDFEDRGAAARSFSFRQISLRDSIVVRLNNTYSLEAQILLRYFERASLFWSAFAESPESGTLERLTKFLIFSRPSENLSVGVGVRLYGIEQRTLGGIPGPATNRRFWAPESSIRWTAPSGSTLTAGGWYEFQRIDETGRRELPNFILQASILL